MILNQVFGSHFGYPLAEVLSLNHDVPEHTLSWTTPFGERDGWRSPFDVQFISASATDPLRRLSVGLRDASVSGALIVLRALACSPLCDLPTALSNISHRSEIDARRGRRLRLTGLSPSWSLAPVREFRIFAPVTSAIGRRQCAACKLVGSIPALLGPLVFMMRRSAKAGLEPRKMR